MNMNSKSTKIVKWSVAILILVLWLFKSNGIIASVFVDNEKRLKEVDISQYSSVSRVYPYVSGQSDRGDYIDTYSITGAAFCETEATNYLREVELILKSEKGAYAIKAAPSEDISFYDQFQDIKQIRGNEIGFRVNFSTINLPSGIYELYIYVRETEDIYGIGNSGYKYIKDKAGFRSFDYGQQIDLDSDCFIETDIPFAYDAVTNNEDGTTYIGGWQALKKSESSDTSVYIEIKTSDGCRYFEVEKAIRKDIMVALGDNYMMSGMHNSLDTRLFEPGNYRTRVVVRYGGKYYISSRSESVLIQK